MPSASKHVRVGKISQTKMRHRAKSDQPTRRRHSRCLRRHISRHPRLGTERPPLYLDRAAIRHRANIIVLWPWRLVAVGVSPRVPVTGRLRCGGGGGQGLGRGSGGRVQGSISHYH